MTESRRTLIASAPTRLDFGGGWTDVPPYPEDRGGFVCNLAINRRAHVRLETAPGALPCEDALAAAALRKSGLQHVRVECRSDFPLGAGLGGSSAAGVALAAAVHAWHGDQRPTPAFLAEWSRAMEVEELGIAGGRQDHYAAAFGGALGLSFAADTKVEPIALTATATAALERQCLLLYTGESRISATTITAVLDAYAHRVPRVVEALASMKSLALLMRDALREGDINRLAFLVDVHWGYQRSLHPGITTERIEAIHEAARTAGASGLKALGASGGGCVIVFAPAHLADQVAEAIAPLGELLPWQVDREGVTVTVQ